MSSEKRESPLGASGAEKKRKVSEEKRSKKISLFRDADVRKKRSLIIGDLQGTGTIGGWTQVQSQQVQVLRDLSVHPELLAALSVKYEHGQYDGGSFICTIGGAEIDVADSVRRAIGDVCTFAMKDLDIYGFYLCIVRVLPLFGSEPRFEVLSFVPGRDYLLVYIRQRDPDGFVEWGWRVRPSNVVVRSIMEEYELDLVLVVSTHESPDIGNGGMRSKGWSVSTEIKRLDIKQANDAVGVERASNPKMSLTFKEGVTSIVGADDGLPRDAASIEEDLARAFAPYQKLNELLGKQFPGVLVFPPGSQFGNLPVPKYQKGLEDSVADIRREIARRMGAPDRVQGRDPGPRTAADAQFNADIFSASISSNLSRVEPLIAEIISRLYGPEHREAKKTQLLAATSEMSPEEIERDIATTDISIHFNPPKLSLDAASQLYAMKVITKDAFSECAKRLFDIPESMIDSGMVVPIPEEKDPKPEE